MAQPPAEPGSKKRKLPKEDDTPLRKHTENDSRAALIGPHETVLAELSSRYNVSSASVISSSKIRQRTTRATGHLLATEGSDQPRIILLHARTDCLCKLITIVETTKRVLTQEGRTWWQYNELYEQIEKPEKKKEVVEGTILEKDGSEDDETTYFETMSTRLERAIIPEPRSRGVKSLRIFLATEPVPELKLRRSVTAQASADCL